MSKQIHETSEKFLEYHAQIECLTASLQKDIDTLFPPFTGHHPEKEYLDAAIAYLQKSGGILKDFSECYLKNYLELLSHPTEIDTAGITDTFKL